MPLVTIASRRLYQAAADQVAQLIRAGEYRPGDRLPPERDLSRQLGVSRPVVREAMVALEIAGLVEVRGGSGVYVRHLAASAPSHVPDAGEGPFEAFVARRALEGEVAAMAALNARAEDLAELTAALEQMRKAPQVGASLLGQDGDRRFHMALAAASGNSVFIRVVAFVWDELQNQGALWARLRERRAVRPTRVEEHAVILQAVRDRDPRRAREAVHAHLDGAIRDFLEMTATETAQPAAGVTALSGAKGA